MSGYPVITMAGRYPGGEHVYYFKRKVQGPRGGLKKIVICAVIGDSNSCIRTAEICAEEHCIFTAAEYNMNIVNHSSKS